MSGKTKWEEKLSPILREPGVAGPDCNCRVIIELSGDKKDEILAIINEHHGILHRNICLIPSLIVELPFSALHALAKSRQVSKVWLDDHVKLC